MAQNKPAVTVDDIVRVLETLRERRPLVHCMTNEVVKDITANILLAIGASPAMVEHAEEAAEFAAIADALLINVGTLDTSQMEAMRAAIASATLAGKPWVLDPVAIGAISLRTRFSREILAQRPALIRGNASEIIALAGRAGKGRGADSGDSAEHALDAAAQLVAQTGNAVLVTGPVDYALDAARTLACANGHPLLTRVTGVGCAQGALAAACVAVAPDKIHGAAAAAVFMAIAGELAAARAPRPGSFRTALIDELDRLDADTIRKYAKIENRG
ncbi:hydroxyethylthiazole kinase [Ereboglobus sp. PH5-5]|uniref:hydroxyethylthiazole kinase n=1 Tax=Ereboglobus sp. PH5-5 TaxID=2940529 RepID=UPI0024076FFF|nr:hydroxyethylthiazole kinase [Ereboglobus sp. PH5-5]MDF9834061.1 hydroxyethylthiazole kinase [Ereboglobus sp. PH5-5]